MADSRREYRYPRPRLRRVVARLLALSLSLAALAVLGQLILAISGRPLFGVSALITATLMIPLVMRTVMHPEIQVTGEGVRLVPMLWQAQSIPWTAITGIVSHPLVYNDDAMGRVLHGKNYRPREGVVILVRRDSGLLAFYRLVGNVAGEGNTPAFALSSTTHMNYAELLDTIRAHLDHSAGV
jgi:hypothetical protein